MYDVIVVAVDGSDPAWRALDEAIGLARSTGARLHLVSVVDESHLVLDEHAAAIESALESEANAALDAARERAESFDVTAVTEVRHGAPSEEIVAFAAAEDADLLVLGTHGRRGLDHALLGSVAERVVRTAECPVLTVHPEHESPLD